MDTAQWAQGIGVVKPMESGSKVPSSSSMLERRARPVKDQALNCPRCNSTNTKFCYYNNYSLSQPRYFCKTCRRYWTEGGSLRNVPVGGGSRKNKRSTPSSSSPPTTTSSKKLLPDLTTPQQQQSTTTTATTSFPLHHQSASQNPKIHQGQDLNLAYPPPPINNNSHEDYSGSNNSSAMELLKSGIASAAAATRGLNSFMPNMSLSDSTNTMYSSAGGLIPMQEFKPSAGLNFSLEGFENNGYGGIQGIHHHQQEGSAGARVLFPTVEDLKQHQHHHHHAEFVEQNRSHQGDSTGYWNGMLGGGSW